MRPNTTPATAARRVNSGRSSVAAAGFEAIGWRDDTVRRQFPGDSACQTLQSAIPPGGSMNRVLAALVLTGAFAAAGLGAQLPSPESNVADRMFLNGRIWTGDPARPWATAMAVQGDALIAVGSDGDVRPLARERTEVIDLKGRFVAPGFNDAHLHFLVIETVDLAQVWSVGEIQRLIRDYASAHKEKPWVVGRGWFYGAFPGGLPHRRLLDEAVPDRPAFMTGYDGHTGWANSRALAAAGITRDTPDPVGGVIVRDESGEPTGVLKETAQRLVRGLVPEPTDEE